MAASWSGDEWQRYCRELLAARHGAHYQPVPDTVAGDWGIEGYTSSGTVYQCYAPEEPLTTGQLYEKHRDKMTADLRKLRKNLAEIAVLVAPAEIECWVLLVPRVEDKRILEHAAGKAAEIRALAIQGISSAFVVRVHTSDDFPTECRQLDAALCLALPKIHPGDDDEVALLAAGDDLDVSTLDGKLTRLLARGREDDLPVLRAEFLRFYVVGRQLEEWVRRQHPALWERWQHSREGVKRTLKTTQITAQDLPGERLRAVLQVLDDAAVSALPTLMSTDASSLDWGTVSSWLIECPLDFSGAADVRNW